MMKEEEEEEEEEAVVSELKRQLEHEDLDQEQRVHLLNSGLNKVLNLALAPSGGVLLTRAKSQLYLSGVLSHCVRCLDPRRLQGDWSAAAMLAQLTSSCCVGLDPGPQSETFHRLFLPSLVDALLSLASRAMRRAECVSAFRKLMAAVDWLLQAHAALATQVLSSVHYEQIQMSDDAAVSLLCVQLWIHSCSNSDFLSGLSDDSALLLLNEAVSQLAVSSDPAVGGACIKLLLLLANQQELRVRAFLVGFKGLDSLLEKDWRGRGFDQEVDQLISLLRSGTHLTSDPHPTSDPSPQASAEHVRAACTIQAAWRSYQTRRRVKSLLRGVSALQRRYRARQQRREAERWEEELRYQVCVSRQQARRSFHLKQRKLLLLLPADQVAVYLQECERRAAVVIQSVWRGFRERRRHEPMMHRAQERARQQECARQRAARTLQGAVRRFLQRRRAAEAPPIAPLWIGREGLTDSRRAELRLQVEEHLCAQRGAAERGVAERGVAERLHQRAQLLLLAALQRGGEEQRAEQRVEALRAHTHTQLELLRDAPPLSVVTATDAEAFLSPSGAVAAQARDAHNATLQTSRLPWWRTLGEDGDHAPGPAHPPELEAELEAELGAELAALFVGGRTEA
ncbi:uncharacterized protein V6R79_003789 [Siganus canaliculatus]